MTATLPGGYTISFTARTTDVPGTVPPATITPSSLPTWELGTLGNPAYPGAYTGIGGQPAWLISGPGGVNKGAQLTLDDIVVTDPLGVSVSGYAFVFGEAESSSVSEDTTWTSDRAIELLETLNPTAPAGCDPSVLAGIGTSTVTCTGRGNWLSDPGPPDFNWSSVLLRTVAPTTVSQAISTTTANGSAFGIMVSKIQLTKDISGRVRSSDSFNLSATSPEGTTVGAASTGSSNSATTGELTVLPRSTSSYSLAEAVTPGSGTRLEDYSQSWSCTRNGVPDPALSASGGTSRAVAPQPGDLIACTVTNTQLPADVEVIKSSVAPLVPGEAGTYRLRVINHGPSRATNAVVSDDLPRGVSFVSAGDGCAETGGTVTCTVASLDVGESRTFTVGIRVDSSADSCADVRNTARVTSDTPDSEPSNNESTICNLERRSDLSLSKVPSSGTVAANGQVMYTMVARNRGPSDDSNVTVKDPVPAGLTLVSAEPAQGSCTTADNTLECDLGSLPSGGSTQVLVTATMTATGCVTNTARVSGDAFDPNLDNNRDAARVCPPVAPPPPEPRFDLVVSKTASPMRPLVGQTVRYRVVVRNNGPDTAPSVTLKDTLNAPVRVVSVKPSQGRCGRAIPMTCELGSIAAGGRVTITVRVKHREPAANCRRGQRNAASATGDGTDTNPANNLDVAKVCPQVRLRLTKVASQDVVRAGETFAYTIRVRNLARVAVSRVRTCDRLPAGLAYVGSQPRARLSKGRHCWTARRIGAGKTKTYRVTVRALPGASGRKQNTATASAPGARTVRDRAVVRVAGQQIAGGGVTG